MNKALADLLSKSVIPPLRHFKVHECSNYIPRTTTALAYLHVTTAKLGFLQDERALKQASGNNSSIFARAVLTNFRSSAAKIRDCQ
jgi:hypothetical protein